MANQPVDQRIVYTAYPCFVLSAVAVNFLAKWGSLTIPPLALNGLRLAVAGVVLLAVALLTRVSLSAKRDLWRFAVVGLLTMALPQALLFYALSRTATPNIAAFAEATVPGIVLIYVLAETRLLQWKPLMCILAALAGLAVFLFTDPVAKIGGATIDILLVLISAAATAGGLILSSILPSPSKPGLGGKLRNSLKNNVYMTCIAGAVTVGCVATCAPRRSCRPLQPGPPSLLWPWWEPAWGGSPSSCFWPKTKCWLRARSSPSRL